MGGSGRKSINVVDICLVASNRRCIGIFFAFMPDTSLPANHFVKSVIFLATSAKSLPTTSGSPPNNSYHSCVLSFPSSSLPRGGCSASTYPVLNLSGQTCLIISRTLTRPFSQLPNPINEQQQTISPPRPTPPAHKPHGLSCRLEQKVSRIQPHHSS